MGVPARFLLEQTRTLGALGRAVLGTIAKGGARAPALPGPSPWIEDSAPAPSDDLIRAFVRSVGGDPSHYRGVVPPHLFPQWTFPAASRLFAKTPYPLVRILNAGTSMTPATALPTREKLVVRARMKSIDDDGTRAILTVEVVTGTRSAPDALLSTIAAYVPLAKKKDTTKKDKKPVPVVPMDARELAFEAYGPNAGRDFALLTGDVNPIHWIPAYARASGFKGCILHGFGMFGHAVEAVVRMRLAGNVAAIAHVEAKFVRPLLLPARAGVYLTETGALYLGDAPGGGIYLDGHISLRGRPSPSLSTDPRQ